MYTDFKDEGPPGVRRNYRKIPIRNQKKKTTMSPKQFQNLIRNLNSSSAQFDETWLVGDKSAENSQKRIKS